MLRHWLVRNGKHVQDPIAYIKTRDNGGNQIDQVLAGIRKLGWDVNNIYVIEKATSKSHKTLKQLVLENM